MPAPGPAPRLIEIFNEALELTSAEERVAYLDRVCATDRSLRDRVEGLLVAHVEGDSFLESPAAAPSVTATPDGRIGPEEPGTIIGPYELMEQIGEGGMGVVYVAEQLQPVRRKVALKIIKPGMDTKQVVARFEAERQALAMMDHPNIARIFDGGVTESGRPFFVMELVRGMPITAYCDGERLSIQGRLDLFVLVCRAVQHAHQKGIIHRDLKPSNILVTLHDGVPVPKIIDFGVAKSIGGGLTEKSVYTAFTQLVGTPLYMSPEQADLLGMDIDTRSDIYSLGVLLYELLTGTTPIDQDTFSRAAFDEMRRIVREEEPAKPSKRLSSLGAMRSTISDNRKADATQLDRTVRGELDWIVMKALEKDRRRRYETANDFAADVMNYLTDRPVEACPPSASYRLAKLARRNRGTLTTVAVISLALVVGTVVSTWQAIQANQATLAEATQRQRAETGEREARANLKKAREAVDQMLVRVAERLANVPHMEQVRRELIGDALKFYVAFSQERSSDPEVRLETALAYRQFGQMHLMLGEHRPAEQAVLKAIQVLHAFADGASDNPRYRFNLAQFYSDLATLMSEQDRLSEAEQAVRQSLAIMRKLDADFPGSCRGWVGARLCLLGTILREAGRLAESESAHREALVIRLEYPQYEGALLENLHNLGVTLSDAGKFEEAVQSYQQALSLKVKLAAKDPGSVLLRENLALIRTNLGGTLSVVGRRTEAEKILRESLAIMEKLTSDFPNIPTNRSVLAAVRHNLGNVLRKTGRLTEAESAFRESLSITEKLTADFPALPSFRLSLANSHNDLGVLLRQIDRLPEAEASHRRAQVIYEKLVIEHAGKPEYRSCVCDNTGGLGLVLIDLRRLGEAEALIRQSLASAEKLLSEFPEVKAHRSALALAYGNLGIVQYRGGDWKSAVASLKKWFELRGEHDERGDAWFFLAMAQWRLGDAEQARKSFDQAARWMDKRDPSNGALRRFRAEAAELLKETSGETSRK